MGPHLAGRASPVAARDAPKKRVSILTEVGRTWENDDGESPRLTRECRRPNAREAGRLPRGRGYLSYYQRLRYEGGIPLWSSLAIQLVQSERNSVSAGDQKSTDVRYGRLHLLPNDAMHKCAARGTEDRNIRASDLPTNEKEKTARRLSRELGGEAIKKRRRKREITFRQKAERFSARWRCDLGERQGSLNGNRGVAQESSSTGLALRCGRAGT